MYGPGLGHVRTLLCPWSVGSKVIGGLLIGVTSELQGQGSAQTCGLMAHPEVKAPSQLFHVRPGPDGKARILIREVRIGDWELG